jgi:hypothetical protein
MPKIFPKQIWTDTIKTDLAKIVENTENRRRWSVIVEAVKTLND